MQADKLDEERSPILSIKSIESPSRRDTDGADGGKRSSRHDRRDRDRDSSDSRRRRDRDVSVDRDSTSASGRGGGGGGSGGDDRERRNGGSDRRRRRDSRDRDRDGGYRESKRRRESRSRSRSRSRTPPPPPPSRRHDERDYDRRPYRGDRGYDNRDRDRRPRSPPRNRRSPSYDEYSRGGKRRSESPGLTEEQREMRSVFVSQLSLRVGDRELRIFFEQVGKVRDSRVIVDKITRRSKGVGYVEFVEQESVQKALAMSNTKLFGIPILVSYTEAEKNRQARDGTGATPGQATGLYVGSLNFALTESDIRQVFQPFGQVDLVDLHKDPQTGKSKGYAFVQFREAKDALTALEKMNNFPLAGREIKVGFVADKTAYRAGGPNGGGGGGGGGGGESLDEGTGGSSLNNISRIELMQKLARSDRPADLPKTPMFRPNIPLATTRNVMLKDAFNPEEETERDWDIELRDDVKSEVESKYGKVADIFVVKESQGEIYIRFETVESAEKSLAGLNGRWFGGRQISASFATDSLFDAKK